MRGGLLALPCSAEGILQGTGDLVLYKVHLSLEPVRGALLALFFWLNAFRKGLGTWVFLKYTWASDLCAGLCSPLFFG